MRHDHDDHADQLRGIEHITHGLTPPDGACGSWIRLYAGVEKFADDLVIHMHLRTACCSLASTVDGLGRRADRA
jgi:regulator of cell morphogenesis and NO signaling